MNSAFYTCLNLQLTSVDMKVWHVQGMQLIKLGVKQTLTETNG